MKPVQPQVKRPCGCGKKKAITQRALPPTRPSCLECVEKHLGASWVLLAEFRDGYPHRLRAIGHLHEAEDESQAWPALHNAIRAARKAYQREGTMPDFASIALRLLSVRELPPGRAQGAQGQPNTLPNSHCT